MLRYIFFIPMTIGIVTVFSFSSNAQNLYMPRDVKGALVTETANNLVLLTNPVHNHLTLIASEHLNGSFNYSIRMTTGQLMQQGKMMLQAGGQYELPLKENLQRGVYTLLVNNTQQSFSYRFVVY